MRLVGHGNPSHPVGLVEGGMYDLVLKGGRVVDPSSGFDGILDVAVENGTIARVAAGIAPSEAARVIEVGGTVVTPVRLQPSNT